MQWYEDEVQAIERRRRAGRFPINAPVFYGSSSIRLWDTLGEDVDPAVVNLGFGGSTLEACDYFFRRLIAPLKPSTLVVYAGDNDLGDGRTPDHVAASFRSLAAKVAQLDPAPRFGFISIKPSPARWGILDRIRAVNDSVLGDMAACRDCFYIDVFPAMLGANGGPRPELFEPDGLHMNRAGYRLWSRLIRPYRNRIVA